MNWITLIILLLGGLAIFMHGMSVMTDSLKTAAGSRMKNFLQSMTRNRWTSMLAGAGITAAIQSSSVTTVLAVGFVSAGLLSFQSTLGVILGANIGTTITAQIIAFKITKAAWVMVASGYLVSVIFRKRTLKETGKILMGLGLVFLGMNAMSEATEPLKSYQPFVQLMTGMDNHFAGILIGTVFTALIQSSSATTGVVIILASQNLISIEGGISMILGANIGTCITAVLSALGKPRDAMRVAVSHVFFKIAGVILWFGLIHQLSDLVHSITPRDLARQIANAHSIFNLGNTFLFIWLVTPVSKMVAWLVPERKRTDQVLFPELHSYYLENPSMAIDLVNDSIRRLGEKTLKIIGKGIDITLFGTAEELHDLRKRDAVIDRGQAEILLFLRKIQSLQLTDRETRRLDHQVEAVNILETAADLVTTHLVEAAEHRIEFGFETSVETLNKLHFLYGMAVEAFSVALVLFQGNEVQDIQSLDKEVFKDRFQEVRSHLLTRLASDDELRIQKYRFESEILEAVRRLHGLARRLERKAG